jgi:pyruvate,water dikinase
VSGTPTEGLTNQLHSGAAFVLALADPAASLELVGGKGASLARLARAGFNVPRGFHLTTAAYRAFVEANALEAPILEAVSRHTSDQAARAVSQLFERAAMPGSVHDALIAAYASLGPLDPAVAVRSSATAEDLPGLSFAGQQDTFLNVRGQDAVERAVRGCWASLWTARAIEYRQRADVEHATVSLAVVVQEMVAAEAAGVLFTADPFSGSREDITINAAFGLGESLVSGEVQPDVIRVQRRTRAITSYSTGEKAVMTVLAQDGTRQVEVPEDRRRAPTLNERQAHELARIGLRIETLYGEPMDVEWAVRGDQVYVLQARPITTLPQDPWNDSRRGDYLWTSGNLGEAVPDVMTPCTWSLMQRVGNDAMATFSLPDCPIVGNIGGRPYMNLTPLATVGAAFGASARVASATEEVFGRIPEGVDVPLLPVSRWQIIRALVPTVVGAIGLVRTRKGRIASFVADAPRHCSALERRVASTSSASELARIWREEIDVLFREACHMLQVAGRQGGTLVNSRARLRALVGERDADALFAGLHSASNPLASLGLLEGLRQLRCGDIDRVTFAERYGHRGPHEFEVSMPRPGEDPAWIDAQLAAQIPTELETMFERRQEATAAAWARLSATQPVRVVAQTRKEMAEWGKVERDREATRSELIRVVWVVRRFVQRAGELTGLGDDLFFLSVDELADFLEGRPAPVDSIPQRRAAYERYRTLPAYPRFIRGRFDPFAWAADSNRRSDVFVAGGRVAEAAADVRGFPGAAGVVEGRVRVLASPEQGDEFRSGEILVTIVTNVGWTPLFPRASAVVTDVGAPLSHAAIVARELGIPAVVGCGNATMRLHTGDIVRVDGSHGTVQLVAPLKEPTGRDEVL